MRRVPAALLVDFSSELAGYSAHSFGAAWDGSVWVVARRSAESPVVEQGIGVFPKSRLGAPTDYRVLRWSAGSIERLTVRDESLLLQFVQPMPGGDILAVGARSYWRSEGGEENAVVYGRDGGVRERFLLGDGIEDVRTTRDGTIWVSYFDEGVFGNFGWGHRGPTPVGAPGLRAFASSGAPRFVYDPARAGTDAICDAYALNVGPDGSVWVYFYTEFPIVRIRAGEYRVWQCGSEGAHALAVDGERALLVGDYEKASRARVVHLGAGSTASMGEDLVLVDDAGAPLEGAQPCGVGPQVFLFDGSRAFLVTGW